MTPSTVAAGFGSIHRSSLGVTALLSIVTALFLSSAAASLTALTVTTVPTKATVSTVGTPKCVMYRVGYYKRPDEEVVEVNGDEALWESVAAKLRSDITSGQLKPGDTLPAEMDLAEEWGMSRSTIRRALIQLTNEGLITEGKSRLGRQVSDRTLLRFDAVRSESRAFVAERAGLGTDSYVTTAQEQGHTARQDINVVIESASPDMAERLGLTAGERVVVRRRIRYLDGKPNDLNDTYYPSDIAEGTPITHPDDVRQGTIALMAEMGYVQDHFSDEVTARMPTPDEARALRMPAGVPLIVQIRTGYTPERPVKVTVTRWRGDRVRLSWEFEG